MDEESLLKEAVRSSWAAWFETFGWIEDKSGAVVPVGEEHRANYLQRKIDEVVCWLRERDLPVRLILLKPRQKGCSTFSTSGLYHDCSRKPTHACIVGGAHDQAANLYGMARLYAERDTFDWGFSGKPRFTDDSAKWPHGSTLVRKTGRNPEVGRSDTYQFLIATELARWAEEGVANAKQVLAGLLKCVPLRPETAVILESTAKGASGDYYDRWQSAVEFEELQDRYERGENVTGVYVRVFAPWYVFEDSWIDLTDEQADKVIETLTEDERDLMHAYNLKPEQIAFRRWAIREECDKDPKIFDQDYPTTAEEAFITAGDLRFNSAGLKRLQTMSRSREPDFGVLEKQGNGRYVWRSCEKEEAMFWRWEEPREGRRYSLPADTMTGISQVSGAKPDTHSPGVMRQGYFDAQRGWQPPALVARVRPECRWDIDVLEEQIWRLSCYYGRCLIVPEENADRGLIELLKRRGANLYLREQFNEREQRITKALGWKTTPRTRPMIIEKLAKAIREWDTEGEGLDLWCPVVVQQLRAFVRKENGREEAVTGKLDDDVLMLAIGITTIEGATRYAEPRVVMPLPRDLRALEEADAGQGLRTYW